MKAEEILKSIGYDNNSITSTEKWIAKELYKKFQFQNKELLKENLALKKQNTELAKLLKKAVRIVKQMEIDGLYDPGRE